MTIKTLWTLSAQQLPETELKGPVFVTIWLFACLIFVFLFHRSLSKPQPTWPEFRLILIGVALLAFWYLFAAIDRWIHYDQRAVKLGYILLTPIWEFSRVASTIILLWGTYTIVWNELEDRFERRHQGYWWFAAKCAIFVVCLMALFYLVLFLALAIVWMEFLSLNTIADIASKRTSFEIAMTAFFTGFGLLTLIAATASIIYKAKRVDGNVKNSRIVLLLAALVLLVRSVVEFAFTLRAYGPDATRRSLALASDVSFGLITCIYLALMCIMAWRVASPQDPGSKDHRRLRSNIRGWLLKKLEQDTSNARKQSPPFSQLLQDLRNRLDMLSDDGTLSSGLSMTKQEIMGVAEEYIQKLHADYGQMDPKQGNFYTSSRSVSSILRKPVRGAQRPAGPSNIASEPNLGHAASRFVSSPVPLNAGRSSAPPNLVPDSRNVTAPGRMQRMSSQGSVGSRVSSNPYTNIMETHAEYPEQFDLRSPAESSYYTRYP